MTNVLNEIYEDWFFRDNIADSLPMAKYLAPKIKEFLNIESVFDVGCATGHWLSCYENLGVQISGLEGTTNAIPHMMIDPEKVTIHDLRDPYEVNQDVDMVYSIEVAEHIEPEYADNYVDALTRHGAKYIIMTAAPPGQGGTGHFNLQPKSYWYDKLLTKGYEVYPEWAEKIDQCCQEARDPEKADPPVLSYPGRGDGTGFNDGVHKPKSTNWLTHDDAMNASTDKLVRQKWFNVWIPWWFPRNMICLKAV